MKQRSLLEAGVSRDRRVGVLNLFPQPPLVAVIAVVLTLDLAFYVAHVAMHKIPAFWSYHLVHHSDPVVDVTTTIRQHPGESVIRYAFMPPSPSCSAPARLPSPCTGPGRR